MDYYICYSNSSMYDHYPIWGCSSVGRATGLHPVGRRFDSYQLHHPTCINRNTNSLRRTHVTDNTFEHDQKMKQKSLTELNWDGNEDRGRYGEDEKNQDKIPSDLVGSRDELRRQSSS